MAVKATWGPKTFLTSPTRIVPFNEFSSTVTLKSDSENDTSGTEPVNTRGRELQSLTCSTTYYVATGSDPIAEFDSWVELLGKSNPLYIGGRKFGPAERFLLQEISAAEMQQAENGEVISLYITLSFIEHSEGKSSKLDGSPSKKDYVANPRPLTKEPYWKLPEFKEEAKEEAVLSGGGWNLEEKKKQKVGLKV